MWIKINSYNKKVINKDVKESKPSNCRAKSKYPLNDIYQTNDVIYKRNVLLPDKSNKIYLGIAEGEIKK